jgi:hypothetical protein
VFTALGGCRCCIGGAEEKSYHKGDIDINFSVVKMIQVKESI